MRQSFRSSRLIVVSNPWTYAHARRFGFTNLIYMPKILDETLYCPGHGEAREVWEQTTGGRFFVLTSSRLDERNKGSSIGLCGFAEFSRHCPEAWLVLIGWGKDVDRERRLLDELGIADRVLILPISGKARLRDYLRSADVFLDQFVLGYFGSAAMEAMACGLPVVGRIETGQYEALSETGVPPILCASDPGEVAAHLRTLYTDDEYRRRAAAEHRDWLCQNHGAERWAPDYCAVLTATAVDWPLVLSDSPLHAPLSEEERGYHAEGMRVAPPHLDYGW
jgi:glycosyltransferase involved in cell wall biosynthesis